MCFHYFLPGSPMTTNCGKAAFMAQMEVFGTIDNNGLGITVLLCGVSKPSRFLASCFSL